MTMILNFLPNWSILGQKWQKIKTKSGNFKAQTAKICCFLGEKMPKLSSRRLKNAKFRHFQCQKCRLFPHFSTFGLIFPCFRVRARPRKMGAKISQEWKLSQVKSDSIFSGSFEYSKGCHFMRGKKAKFFHFYSLPMAPVPVIRTNGNPSCSEEFQVLNNIQWSLVRVARFRLKMPIFEKFISSTIAVCKVKSGLPQNCKVQKYQI